MDWPAVVAAFAANAVSKAPSGRAMPERAAVADNRAKSASGSSARFDRQAA